MVEEGGGYGRWGEMTVPTDEGTWMRVLAGRLDRELGIKWY